MHHKTPANHKETSFSGTSQIVTRVWRDTVHDLTQSIVIPADKGSTWVQPPRQAWVYRLMTTEHWKRDAEWSPINNVASVYPIK